MHHSLDVWHKAKKLRKSLLEVSLATQCVIDNNSLCLIILEGIKGQRNGKIGTLG